MPRKTVKRIAGIGRRPFASLSVRNYRLYFIGQGISLSGTWLQMVAQTWLVLELTHSGTQLGLVTAMQFLPVLLLGPYGGLIADRFAKRRIIYLTQSTAMTLAFIMALLVGTHVVQVWMVYVLAVASGLVQMVDSPTRQTFIIEMVGPKKLTNAISLNSIEVNLARVVGPLLAASLIAGFGIAWCFFINGLSFIIVLTCLWLMDASELRPQIPTARGQGQLREGFSYIWRTPVLRNVLAMMFVVGALAYEFQVVIPLFATQTFHGTAGSYAAMMAAMGLGSFIGGIVTASRGKPSPTRLLSAALTFGVSLILVSLAPSFDVALLLFVLVGFGSVGFTALSNSTLQLNSAPDMRGRVMSIWVVAFLGSTPVGGPIIGWISEHGSPRLGLATGGMATLAAAAFGLAALFSYRRSHPQQTA